MPTSSADLDLQPLCSLVDPTRRQLYDHVCAQGRPVTRDEASGALGLDRSLAAYHLDKLVEQGLLAVSFARPEGRSGPGAGRPAKRYERSSAEFAASVPARSYELAADLLARAVELDSSGTVRAALERAADHMGRELAAQAAAGAHSLMAFLKGQGFEPYDDGGVIRLRNCPFRRLAEEHTELVCGMNRALLGGAVAEIDRSADVRLDPAPGRCCVALDVAR